ncbi:MAG: hypothetical protein Q9171_005472, partial [Xanthocarpia ochracea]
MYSTGLKARTVVSNIGPGSRPQSKGNQEKNLWSSLLDSVASGKKLPEKYLLVLDPWSWARQVRDWVRFLKGVVVSMDDECKVTAEETMQDWQHRRRGAAYEGGTATSDVSIHIPLGQGEWDEPLGLPICVACHGTEKIEILEKDHGWREEEFDFSLQYLRTVLLKHGSSLIYTSLSIPNSLPTLIHSSLGIHSLLKRQTIKHNVIDRDKILVPPNWDSWGKIRVLREGFDVEGISSGWSLDIQLAPIYPPTQPSDPNSADTTTNKLTSAPPTERPPSPNNPGSVLSIYEQTILNPYSDRPSTFPPMGEVPLETTVPSMQEFLKSVQEEMIRLTEAEENTSSSSIQPQPSIPSNTDVSTPTRPSSSVANALHATHPYNNQEPGKVNEHIGPVQFNMGGIQVDADEMVKRLKEKGEKEKG